MADDIQRASFDMNLTNAKMISRRTFLQSRDYNYDTEQKLIEKESIDFARDSRTQMGKQAEAQGEAMLTQTRYQIQSQQMQQEAQAQMQQQAPPPGQQPQQQGAEQAQQQQAQQQQGPPPEQGAPPPGQQPGAEQQAPPQQAQQGAVQGVEQSPMDQQVAQAGGSMVDLFAQAKKLGSQVKAMNEVDRYRAMAQLRSSNPDLYMLVNNYLSGSGMKPMKPLPEKLPPRAAPDSAQI